MGRVLYMVVVCSQYQLLLAPPPEEERSRQWEEGECVCASNGALQRPHACLSSLWILLLLLLEEKGAKCQPRSGQRPFPSFLPVLAAVSPSDSGQPC